MKTISNQRLFEFIKNSIKYYSWQNILQLEHLTGWSDKGDQYEIVCPFHTDKRPSMRLTKSTGQYYCFSCNRKGTYTRFLWELHGSQVPYGVYCENILKSNVPMQHELGFNSLMVENNASTIQQGRRTFEPQMDSPKTTLTTLAKKIMRKERSWDRLTLSLTLLQKGVPMDYVLKAVENLQPTESESACLSDFIEMC